MLCRIVVIFLDIIDPNETGLVFEKNNDDALHQTIQVLLENSSLVKTIGIKAERKVQTKLNWQWNAEAICRILNYYK